MNKNKLTRISSVRVKELFKLYDYELELGAQGSTEDEKISIFYGDNGSGKSTLLRLAFHMLAPNPKQGHKSHLLDVEFKELSVTFNDGTIVKAYRKVVSNGEYTISVKRARKQPVEATIFSRETRDSDVYLHEKVEPALRDLDCSLYLLSDDRAIQRAGGSLSNDDFIRRLDLRSKGILIDEFGRPRRERFDTAETPEDMAKQLLSDAIETTEDWFRRRVIGSSSKGDSGVNDIYKQILKRISDSGGGSSENIYSKVDIEKKVNELQEQSRKFSKYGLLAEFDGEDILSFLKNTDKPTMNLIIDVLAPYLDSIETKHNAMLDIYERIDTFVTVASRFYTNKNLTYDLRNGIQIWDPNKKLLTPHMLSSGERHLLLLFCTSIVAGGSPSILMIDEPEISLNIKWQRMLIDALIQCIGENDIQFIFSTHSFEILSKHKSRVVKLENTHG
ncbi:AAA family ATPase [Aeromonas hydrophila]|nr:ATP-binding protein [Aeromonas hydrophila]